VDYLSYDEEDDVKDPQEKVEHALFAAAQHAATVVVKEGSVGIGYDYDPPAFEDVVNVTNML
jgi:hypothetical protein